MSDNNYVVILRESLEKKVRILNDLQELNMRQAEILEDPNSTPEEFEENVDAKEELINEITTLDEGFEQLFADVQSEVEAKREVYADEIQKMKELIREITSLGVRVQTQEKANYELAQTKFSDVRKQVKKVRHSQKAVNNYYRDVMSSTYYEPYDPIFMDSKK